MTWASYNKPAQIQKNDIQYDFGYDPDRARYQKVHSNDTTATTLYADGAIEQMVQRP